MSAEALSQITCADSNCAGCRFPPSSQAGAGLAAVHNPALRNRAASQNAPPNTSTASPPRGRVAPRGNDTRTKSETLFTGGEIRELDARLELLIPTPSTSKITLSMLGSVTGTWVDVLKIYVN